MGKVKRFVELLKPRRDAVEDTTPLILRTDSYNDAAKDAADRQLMDNIVFHMRSAELGGDRSANNTTSDGCGNGSVSPTTRDVRDEVGGQVDMRRRSQRCTCCQFPRHAKRSDFLYHRLACSCDVDVMITTNQDEAPQTQGVLNERPSEAEQCLVDDTMCDDTEQGWAEMCKIIGKHIPFRTNYQYVSTPDRETFNTSANNITTGRPSMEERMLNDSNVKRGIPMDGSYDPVNDQQIARVYGVCLTPNCGKPVVVNCRNVPYASMRSSYGLNNHCVSRCKPKLKGFCRRGKEIRFCPYSSASSQRRQNVRFCRQNTTRNCRWGLVNEASGPPYPYLYRASVRNDPRDYNVSSRGTLRGGYVGSQNRIYGDCSAFRKVPGGVIQSSCKFCPRLHCRQQCAGGRYYNEHETYATLGTDRGLGFYPIHVGQSINRCGGPYLFMPTQKIDVQEDAQTSQDVFSKSNVNKSSKGLVPSRKKNKDTNSDIEEESVHSNSIAGNNAENTRSFVHDVESSVFSSKAHVCKCTQVENTSDVSCATHDFTLEQQTAGVLDKLSETSNQGDIETEDKFTFSLPHTILENGTVKPGLVNGTKDPISSSPVTANSQRDHPVTEVPPAENTTVSKYSSPKCSYRAVKAVSGSNMATDLPDSHPEGNCSNNHDQILISSNSTPNHYHLYKEQCHICGTMVQRSTPESANIAANRASFNCRDDLGSDDTNDRLFAGITNTTNGKIHETTNSDDKHFNNNSTSSCCHHHGKRKQLNGRVIRVEGDGRCLFRSLVTVSYEALRLTDRDDFGRPEKRKLADMETVLADNLRGTVVAFMKENLKFYSQLENSIINADQPVTSNYKKFLDRLSAMSNPTTMPGDLELNALAAVLEREIIVLDTTLRVITTYGFDKFPLAVPVAVRYTRILPDVGHYDAVVLENQDKTVTPNKCFPTTDHSSEAVRKITPEKSTDTQRDLLEATKKFFEMNPSGQKRSKGQKTTKVHGEARLNAKKEFFYARNSDKIMHSNGIIPLHPQHSSVEKMEVEQSGKSPLPVTRAALCTKNVENTENKTMQVGQPLAGTPSSVTRSTQTEDEASDVLIPGESRYELVQRSLTPEEPRYVLVQRSLTPEEPRYVLVQRSSTPNEPRYMPVQKRSGPSGARERRKTFYKCFFHPSNGWLRRRVQKEKRFSRRRNATTARPVKISRRRPCKFSAIADKNVNWNNRASNGSEKRRRKPLKKVGTSDLHRVRKTVPSTASRSCKCKVCKVGHKRPVCLKQSAKRATNTSGNSNSGEKERQLPSKSNEPTSSGRSRPSDQQAKRQRSRPYSRANRSPSASQLPAVGGGLIGDDKFLPNRSPQKPDILPPYLPQRVQVPFKESTARCPVCNSRVSERTSVKCYICGRMAHRACVMKESLIREDGGGDQRYFMCSVCLSI